MRLAISKASIRLTLAVQPSYRKRVERLATRLRITDGRIRLSSFVCVRDADNPQFKSARRDARSAASRTDGVLSQRGGTHAASPHVLMVRRCGGTHAASPHVLMV